MDTSGLKPTFLMDALRGAEAPLFHGAISACVSFLRNLPSGRRLPHMHFCKLGYYPPTARLEAVPFPNPLTGRLLAGWLELGVPVLPE
jgi:hypothetical protein